MENLFLTIKLVIKIEPFDRNESVKELNSKNKYDNIDDPCLFGRIHCKIN